MRGETRHGLARVISKRGACSRSEAERWVLAGRISVEGRVVRDPQWPTRMEASIAVDGRQLLRQAPIYIAFNKPRGVVTTASDERGRATVYDALATAELPWLGVVGRLDKASEGLLLLSNDTAWANGITAPASHRTKVYHVQVDQVVSEPLIDAMKAGVRCDGERLRVVEASLLRAGQRHCWLEVVLDEGRNRQIRRLLDALGVNVLRLVRVAIGDVALGDLPKGQWRHLSAAEVAALRPAGPLQ